jgi:hypothetical protein
MHTSLAVTVARARNTKLEIVMMSDKYELNVGRSEDPSRRFKKYGVAVIIAIIELINVMSSSFLSQSSRGVKMLTVPGE